MFSKAKDKTKTATFKLRAKVTTAKTKAMAGNQTVSLANIPMTDSHGVLAQPTDNIPGLYVTGKAPKPVTQTKAKKALRFENVQEQSRQLTPTAPLLNAADELEGEEIIEHDTATQTSPSEDAQSLPGEAAQQPQMAATETMATDNSESPEEDTPKATGTSSGQGRPPRRTKKFRSVYLTRSTKGKQFRPRSPISNTAAYPIVWYLHAAQFKSVAKELNTLVRFFNVNTITPFMYDAELQFFIANYRQQPCPRLPFLRFAMENMFERYRLQVSPNVNRPNDREMQDGEWVDIDDDSDDEISFPTTQTQVNNTDRELEDTLLLNRSTRQQDEYLDDDPQPYDTIPADASGLNESVYISAEEGEDEEYVEYDRYQDEGPEQYYTPQKYIHDTDRGLYNNTQSQAYLASSSGVGESHARNSNLDKDYQADATTRQPSVDTGYETEVGSENTTIPNVIPLLYIYDTNTYMHKTTQDEFMGQFDDIDKIAYNKVNQVSPQVVSNKMRVTEPRTILIHSKPDIGYQDPLIVHQVQDMFGATSSPKKPFPPPRWPVNEVPPNRQEARRTATITSIFHEDDLHESHQGREPQGVPRYDAKTDTKQYQIHFTQSDAAGDKDLMAGNGRRNARGGPNPRNNPPPNPRNNPPNINFRRNPPCRARQVPGRGPAPQPVGPQPQPVGPQPQPVGPQPQPVGPQLQPVGPQPQPIPRIVPPAGPGGPGGPGPGSPGGPGGPGGPGPRGPGGPGGPRGRGHPNRGRGHGRQLPRPPLNPNPNPPQPPQPNPPPQPPPNPPPNPNPPQPPQRNLQQPGRPNQPVDWDLVDILNRLVTAQERQASDKNESKRFTQFPTVKFDGSEPAKSLDHWNIFMQYWIYVLRKGYVPDSTDPTYYTIFCQQFILTHTGIAYTWFKQIQDNFNDINDIKASFLKQFNEWGQTVKQHMTAWNSLKFDVQKHDMDVFTRKLKLLASILFMTDEQTLEKFKDSFDTTIAAHLIECTTLAEAREKAEQLVFLYKSTMPVSVATVLIHNSLPETKETNEHQLAPVPKQDKKGFNPRDKPRQTNNTQDYK